MKGLQIYPSLIEITNVRNMSRSKSNDWNEVNYAKELKRTRNFVLTHDAVSLELKITELGKRITFHTKYDKVLWMYT